MSVGVVVSPGSNCDRDVRWASEGCLGIPTRYLWHEERDLSGLDAVVLPGGFSYGDYLRCGAMAARIADVPPTFKGEEALVCRTPAGFEEPTDRTRCAPHHQLALRDCL